ncbi:MAG: metallophosphatase family protein [Defluviitaleaceae bacterium]|nr:metallophosphatase family protein [Defluviitaleaceae bacterium]
MKRIAVISDIHGNLPALEATIKDIRQRAVDRIICLGDLIGKGPNATEVIEICRNECETVVKGNWDDFICEAHFAPKKDQETHFGGRTRWYINNMRSQDLDYLHSLPHGVEIRLSGRLIRLFHAHPKNYNRYHQDSPLAQRLELFEPFDFSKAEETSDVALYADIHNAYLQMVQGKCLINVGSVGNPLDITQASYVILEGEESDGSFFDVRFVRVPYDIEMAITLAVEADVPDLDGYITELRTAKYFRRG